MFDPPTLADKFKFNASLTDSYLDRAISTYRYAIDRRDRLMERLRIGAFTLNAASVLGVISRVQTPDSDRLARFLNPLEPMLLAFLLGTVAAGLSMVVANRRFHEDASNAANELRTYQRIKARLMKTADKRAVEELGADIKELAEQKVPDFSHSPWEFRWLSVSLALWVTGLAIPIANLAKAIDWSLSWPF